MLAVPTNKEMGRSHQDSNPTSLCFIAVLLAIGHKRVIPASRNWLKILPTLMPEKPSLHTTVLGRITVKHVHLSQVCVSQSNRRSRNEIDLTVTTPFYTPALTYMSVVLDIQGVQLPSIDLPKDFAKYHSQMRLFFQKQSYRRSKV